VLSQVVNSDCFW